MIRYLGFILFLFLPMIGWGQDSCSKTCVISSECGVGGLCEQGLCQYQKSFCFNERWAANDRGEASNCDAYRCDSEKGLCLRKAQSTQDCLTGYVFDGVSLCLRSVSCNSVDSHCQDLLDRWKKARDEFEQNTPEPRLTPWSCMACETSETCGAEKMCWQNRCVSKSPYCRVDLEGEHHQVISQLLLPESKACGNYACDQVSGECFNSCLKESDCRSGRKCDAGLCR